MESQFAWVQTGWRIWQLESPVGSRRFHGTVWADGTQPVFAVPGGFSVVHSDGRIEERGQGERATVRACKQEIMRRFLEPKS